MAPAQIRDSRMAAALLHFAARYSNGMPATLDIALPDQVPATAEELRQIEATHQVCQCRTQHSVKSCLSQKHKAHCVTIRYCMHGWIAFYTLQLAVVCKADTRTQSNSFEDQMPLRNHCHTV